MELKIKLNFHKKTFDKGKLFCYNPQNSTSGGQTDIFYGMFLRGEGSAKDYLIKGEKTMFRLISITTTIIIV